MVAKKAYVDKWKICYLVIMTIRDPYIIFLVLQKYKFGLVCSGRNIIELLCKIIQIRKSWEKASRSLACGDVNVKLPQCTSAYHQEIVQIQLTWKKTQVTHLNNFKLCLVNNNLSSSYVVCYL